MENLLVSLDGATTIYDGPLLRHNKSDDGLKCDQLLRCRLFGFDRPSHFAAVIQARALFFHVNPLIPLILPEPSHSVFYELTQSDNRSSKWFSLGSLAKGLGSKSGLDPPHKIFPAHFSKRPSSVLPSQHQLLLLQLLQTQHLLLYHDFRQRSFPSQ